MCILSNQSLDNRLSLYSFRKSIIMEKLYQNMFTMKPGSFLLHKTVFVIPIFRRIMTFHHSMYSHSIAIVDYCFMIFTVMTTLKWILISIMIKKLFIGTYSSSMFVILFLSIVRCHKNDGDSLFSICGKPYTKR